MDRERFERQRDFILEIDREKEVLRQTHITGYVRREDDAEHAWHMAVMAYLLGEYANEPVDIVRTMIMCLVHDVVEIDAGDSYAYDSSAQATHVERETRAAERIFGLLPDDQAADLRALWEEFEADETPEARFARAMDNVQPLMLNDSNGGRDWVAHDVSIHETRGRNATTRLGSEELADYVEERFEANVEKGSLRP
ncbi:MAG: HD domain-containing protein [Olsenella sp.]